MLRAATIADVPTAMLHLVAAALVISGLDKIRAPRPATEAWRTAGLPGRRLGERLPGTVVGIVEVVVGAAAVITGSVPAAVAVAVLYLAFAGFLKLLSSRDATAGCGCFSASTAPPGPAHLVLDVGAAAAAVTAAVAGALPASEILRDGPAVAIPYALLLATGAFLLLTGPALTSQLRHLRSGAAPRTFTIDTETAGRH